MKEMIIISGTPGSGKTSLGRTFEATCRLPFISTEMFYKEKFGEFRDYSHEEMLEATLELKARRNLYLANGISFAIERGFQKAGQVLRLIEDARRHGFRVILIYLGFDELELNIARIKSRVMCGGEGGSYESVLEAIEDGVRNFATISSNCDASYIFDNSGETPKLLFKANRGEEKPEYVIEKRFRPKWMIDLVTGGV